MLGIKLNHVSKRGLWSAGLPYDCHSACEIILNDMDKINCHYNYKNSTEDNLLEIESIKTTSIGKC